MALEREELAAELVELETRARLALSRTPVNDLVCAPELILQMIQEIRDWGEETYCHALGKWGEIVMRIADLAGVPKMKEYDNFGTIQMVYDSVQGRLEELVRRTHAAEAERDSYEERALKAEILASKVFDASIFCSIRHDNDKPDPNCSVCYPDINALLAEHVAVATRLRDELDRACSETADLWEVMERHANKCDDVDFHVVIRMLKTTAGLAYVSKLRAADKLAKAVRGTAGDADDIWETLREYEKLR